MPLTNYFNPDAMKPQQGYVPSGPLGGGQYAQQTQRADFASGLQRLLIQDQLKKQMMETQSYGMDAPVRAAERPSKISGFQLQNMLNQAKQPFAGELAMGDVGKARSALGTGKFDLETAPERIGSEKASKTLKTMEDSLQKMEYLMGASDDVMSQGLYQDMRRTLPKHLQKYLPPEFTQDARERMGKLSKALQNNAEQRRKMDVEKEETRRAWGTGILDLQEARERTAGSAAAKTRTALEQLRRSTNPGQRVSVAAQILSDTEASSQATNAALAALRVDGPQLAASFGVRMPPLIPGLPPHQALQWIEQLQQEVAKLQRPGGFPNPQPSPGGPIDFGALPK